MATASASSGDKRSFDKVVADEAAMFSGSPKKARAPSYDIMSLRAWVGNRLGTMGYVDGALVFAFKGLKPHRLACVSEAALRQAGFELNKSKLVCPCSKGEEHFVTLVIGFLCIHRDKMLGPEMPRYATERTITSMVRIKLKFVHFECDGREVGADALPLWWPCCVSSSCDVYLSGTQFVTTGRFTPLSTVTATETAAIQSLRFLKHYVSKEHPYGGAAVNVSPVYTLRYGDQSECALRGVSMPYHPLAESAVFNMELYVDQMTQALRDCCKRVFK